MRFVENNLAPGEVVVYSTKITSVVTAIAMLIVVPVGLLTPGLGAIMAARMKGFQTAEDSPTPLDLAHQTLMSSIVNARRGPKKESAKIGEVSCVSC